MSFLRGLNRKQRRQFDKLHDEEKKQIVAHEISEKIKDTTQKQIGMAFAQGVMWGNKLLYDKYVTQWDSSKYNGKHKIAKELVEEIRMHYEKGNKVFPNLKDRKDNEDLEA